MIKFSIQQRKIIKALYYQRLWRKLSNYVLIEAQKTALEDHVIGYPFWLVIDPTNFCTLKCPFCPSGQGRNSRTKTIMSFENFKKIIDELGPYLIHIDFCNWGEPLLNKQIYEMVKYAKQYHIDTKIDSNFNHFNEEDAEKIILSGLDKLIVSIDGAAQETYSKYRVGGDFNKVIKNLKLLIKKKKEMKKSNPFISWQFLVFRHNEHEIEKVKKIGKKLGVDRVGITKAFIGDKDWVPKNKEYSNYDLEKVENSQQQIDKTSAFLKSPQENICNWLWEGIVINSNGSTSPCCSVEDEKDDFGKIFNTPFKEIWNNEKYKSARRYIKDKKIAVSENNNVCIGCKHLGLINFDILSCHSFFKL